MYKLYMYTIISNFLQSHIILFVHCIRLYHISMQCCWKCWKYLVSKRCMQLHLGKCKRARSDWNNFWEEQSRCCKWEIYFKFVDTRSESNIALRASWKLHHNHKMFKRGEGWLGVPECTKRLAIMLEIIRLFCQRAICNDRLRRLSFRTMPGWLALRKQCSWSLKTWINNRAQQLQICAQTFFGI